MAELVRTCHNCSVYAAEIIALKLEQAQRNEEVCILRESQRDCISMAEDIQHMQNCIEEQRRHMLRTSGRNVDADVGLQALLSVLSKKERQKRQDLVLSVRFLEQERTKLAAVAAASHDEYAALMHNFQALSEHCTAISTQLWFVAANLESEELKHREACGTVQLLNQANKHLQKELQVQYACIEEQRRHMRGEHRDGEVGIHMLIESVKQNELALFHEKLTAQGVVVQTRYERPLQHKTLPVTSDLHSVEKATREDNAKLREDNAKLRDDNAKLREDNEVVVGRSKKLCIVLHGLLDVKTTEITKMKALLTKLVHSLSEKKLQMEELVQSNLKLKTINVEALKSRDSLQVKLYNVVLEKQRSDTEMQALQTTTRALQTQVQTLQTQVQTLQDALAKSKKQNTTLVAFSKRVTSLTQTIDADLLR
jgi:hypothetical protein